MAIPSPQRQSDQADPVQTEMLHPLLQKTDVKIKGVSDIRLVAFAITGKIRRIHLKIFRQRRQHSSPRQVCGINASPVQQDNRRSFLIQTGCITMNAEPVHLIKPAADGIFPIHRSDSPLYLFFGFGARLTPIKPFSYTLVKFASPQKSGQAELPFLPARILKSGHHDGCKVTSNLTSSSPVRSGL